MKMITPNMKIPKRMYKKLLKMVSSRVLQDALRDNFFYYIV